MAQDIFVEARYYKDNVAATSGEAAFAAVVLKSMATALQSGLLTCTSSVSGKAGADVLAVINQLVSLGYSASVSSTTLTVAWS